MEKLEPKELPKIKDILVKDWPVILLILGSLAIGLYYYPALPAKIPNHWNFKGEINGYASKTFGVMFMPLLCLGMYLLFTVIPLIDPKKQNYTKFMGSYRAIRLSVIILLLAIYLVSIFTALGYNLNMPMVIQLGLGIMFMVLGNYITRVRNNYFVGIRTPWTLASEEVWRRTHRLAGPLWVLAGALTILGASIGSKGFFVLLGAVAIAGLIPSLYSFVIYRKLQG